jgi:hypothetical protein
MSASRQLDFVATCHRRAATNAHTVSTIPNGHAPGHGEGQDEPGTSFFERVAHQHRGYGKQPEKR